MTVLYSSLATAQCEFTFGGRPTFSASFSASASDMAKKKAMKLSKKVVSTLTDKYIKEQSSTLINKNIIFTYKVTKHVEEKEKKSSCGCGK
jgi:hemerythrin superfamily protein